MASLDVSLDDMIKSRRTAEKGRGQQGKAQRGGGGGGGRGRGGGRMRGKPNNRGGGRFLRVNTTAATSAFNIAKSNRRSRGLPWQRDLLEESLRAVGLPAIENESKLFVSNLDSGVSNQDIRELFSEIGELKRYAIHYDKDGRPTGSAEVVFNRRSDAFQALKKYNNVQLDGKPMKIEIAGASSDVPVLARGNVVGVVNGKRTVVMKPGMIRRRGSNAFGRNNVQRSRSGIINNSRGGVMNARGGRGNTGARGGMAGRGGRTRGRGNTSTRGGRGGGRGGKNNADKSADQLDKELENYHAEAMQT
ncbi:THO complex subunit 4C isoform X1 [Daucus carota subsp. sativus]|uniref:THO complex subunit 4C isoform X1 n=1 Tax=Daucus carota subsp. sativus TaxID=79200 RepID=UPI0007F000B5|nr:PREDICTED: THO complex subunit 4C-like [Daucus carota subsp. sativus]